MEIKVLKWINDNWHGSSFVNHSFKFVSYLGDFITIWGVLAIILLCLKKTRKQGLCLGMGLACIAVFGYAIKLIVDRSRPFEKAPELAVFIKSINMALPDSASFPSGHTIASFASAMILTLCFGKKGAWSFILATMIAFSRLFLCVHYPTDILAGMILGVGVATAFYFVFNYMWKILENKFKKEDALDSESNNEM